METEESKVLCQPGLQQQCLLKVQCTKTTFSKTTSHVRDVCFADLCILDEILCSKDIRKSDRSITVILQGKEDSEQ